MGSFNQALLFLVTVVFNLYIWILMLRVILHKIRADYFNPLSQFIIRTTNKMIKPLKKLVPDVGGFELATVIVILLVEGIKLGLLYLIYRTIPLPLVMLLQLIGDVSHQLLNLYFYLLIINAITSWIANSHYNPSILLLNHVVDPILRPFRKIIPPIGGIDVTPIAALIILKVIDIAVIMPLMQA